MEMLMKYIPFPGGGAVAMQLAEKQVEATAIDNRGHPDIQNLVQRYGIGGQQQRQ